MALANALNDSSAVSVELEKVRDKVPLLFERDDTTLALIQRRGDVEVVSNRAMRLPLQVSPGGNYANYSPDGGLIPVGTGTQYGVATVSAFHQIISGKITKLAEYGTNTTEKAIANVVKREVVNVMKQFRMGIDALIQTSGNGVLGIIGTVSTNTFTMNIPTGAAPFYVNQQIQVYNAGLTTNRGTANITQTDPLITQQIVVDAAPGGTVATDAVVLAGLSGTLTTQSALFGIKYHQSNATSGTWLGINRATAPYTTILQTPRVNGGSSALTPGMARLAYNLSRKALGVDQLGKLVAHTALEQEHAWENLGVTISQIIKEQGGGTANDLDLLFTGKKTIGGVPIKVAIHADQTRVDFLDLSHWGRSVLKEIGQYDYNGNGLTVVPLVDQATGQWTAAFQFSFDTSFQVWVDSPRSGSYIDSLARPSGY